MLLRICFSFLDRTCYCRFPCLCKGGLEDADILYVRVLEILGVNGWRRVGMYSPIADRALDHALTRTYCLFTGRALGS